MTGIYKITSPSGKIYIGQSWNIKKRISDYKSLSVSTRQTLLNRSFSKYGYQNHRFEIIKELDKNCSQSDLDMAEIFYIYKYRSLCFKMMNLTIGGKGGKGTKRKKRVSSNVLYDLYVIKNHTKKEISEIVNQKERLIKKYLAEYGIKKPHSLKLQRDENIKNLSNTRVYGDEIIRLRNNNLSYSEILKILPVTHAVISNTIRKHKNNNYDLSVSRA